MKDISVIASILKELFKKNNILTKFVALAIPRSSVIIKNIAIDSRLNIHEIESRAWIEANNHFPDLVGEIYLDYSVSPSAEDTSQLDLTLVACRKDQIKPYLEVLREAGLTAKVIDVNSYALERALSIILEATPELNTVALLNLDTNLSTFLVVDNQKLIYAHDHSYDGQKLQSQTQEYLKNSIENVASLSDLSYVEILKGSLSAHLRHTMHFFYSSRPNINIQKVIISGDCATIPCLGAFIQQEIDVPVLLGNPFEHMTVSDNLNAESLHNLAPMLFLSCGLALSVDKPLDNHFKYKSTR
jgi:type IV pilus assembly protein PilM